MIGGIKRQAEALAFSRDPDKHLRGAVKDPSVKYTIAACKAYGVEVLVSGATFRLGDGSIMSRDELTAMIISSANLVEGKLLSIPRVGIGLTRFEQIFGREDPFVELAARYCDPKAENPQRAWELATEAALLPFRYAKNPLSSPATIDAYAANLLCFAIQIKRKLLNEDFGDVDGLLNMWGESGSGKTAFIKRFCSPFKSVTNEIGSLEEVIQGFDGLQVGSSLCLVANDAHPISIKYINRLKEFVTGSLHRTAAKFKDMQPVPIRCGLIVSANKAPDVQYPDAAFTRRLFSWRWPIEIPFLMTEDYVRRVVPAWDAEAFWRAVPLKAPLAWRQLVHESRQGLFTPEDPIENWIDDVCGADPQAAPVPLKTAFAKFKSWAEDGNWPISGISVKVFGSKVRLAGFDVSRDAGGMRITGMCIKPQ